MSNNQGVIAINNTITAINNNDVDEIRRILALFPLGQLPKGTADTLLAVLLKSAIAVANVDAVRVIVSIFDVARITSDPVTAVTNLFLNPELDIEMLRHITSCFPEKVPFDYYVDLVNMGDDLGALKAASAMLTVFPDLSNTEWSMLFKLTENFEDEEYENQLLRAFFEAKLKETGDFAAKPQYVKNFKEVELPAYPECIPAPHEAIELIISKFDLPETENEDDSNIIHSSLVSEYSIATAEHKIRLLEGVATMESFDDSALFREYGPVNTIYSVTSEPREPEDVCGKHGGCRMLLCTEFEILDGFGAQADCMSIEEHQNTKDWYRGKCDVCNSKIHARHCAVRLPLKQGGWQGCFCSLKCLTNYSDDHQVSLMIGHMTGQLEAIGIRDR